MADRPRSSIAADALDRLVLDLIEIEHLASEIAAALEGIGPGARSNLRIATQLLELLHRAQEADLAIDRAASRRINSLIAGLAAGQNAEKTTGQCRRRTALVAV